jgi:hypothetical protein
LNYLLKDRTQKVAVPWLEAFDGSPGSIRCLADLQYAVTQHLPLILDSSSSINEVGHFRQSLLCARNNLSRVDRLFTQRTGVEVPLLNPADAIGKNTLVKRVRLMALGGA